MIRNGGVILVLAAMASCGGARGGVSGSPFPTSCSGDVSEVCSCASGTVGTRTCQADGTFAACVCTGEDASISMDATVIPDLPGIDLPQAEATTLDRTLTCTAPRLDCDGDPANGCETDTSSEARHCGRCGNACPAGQPCTAGVCASMSCATGRTRCAEVCADLQTDIAHCGACGNRCNTGDRCTNGRCTPPAGMCPSSCRAEADCAPCRSAGDTGNYCCISGLCLYMSGACGPVGVGDGGDLSDVDFGDADDAALD